MRQRPLGFRNCLVEVLTKLTGQPDLARNPLVADLAEHAETLVAAFDYVDPRAALLHKDDQGTYDRSYELTVRFDPAKIDAALDRLGLPIWHGPRPLLDPIVLVRDRELTPFYISFAAPRGAEMRQTIVRAASELGVGVHFPTESDLAEAGVGLVGFPAPLDEAKPGHLRVVGTLSWDVHEMGWIAVWRALGHEWKLTGVGYDAAFASMLRGAVMLAAGTGTP